MRKALVMEILWDTNKLTKTQNWNFPNEKKTENDEKQNANFSFHVKLHLRQVTAPNVLNKTPSWNKCGKSFYLKLAKAFVKALGLIPICWPSFSLPLSMKTMRLRNINLQRKLKENSNAYKTVINENWWDLKFDVTKLKMHPSRCATPIFHPRFMHQIEIHLKTFFTSFLCDE